MPVYLLWTAGTEQTIDLRDVAGPVRVVEMTGVERTEDAASLRITADPVIVEPLE
jgi:hypothetical protein